VPFFLPFPRADLVALLGPHRLATVRLAHGWHGSVTVL
jgi:hypothetical protein